MSKADKKCGINRTQKKTENELQIHQNTTKLVKMENISEKNENKVLLNDAMDISDNYDFDDSCDLIIGSTIDIKITVLQNLNVRFKKKKYM